MHIIFTSIFKLTFPLKNPVLIFSLILFIILFAPIILNKLKIPHLIGLIIAGAIIGPHGLNLMMRDSSIILFGTVGLLYIMFLAGLEIDLVQFKKNSYRSIIFGLYTFSIPMLIGTTVSYYLLEFSIMTSILLASMFASHTLIAYPIISKLGITKNRAVNITVGGTMITDILALLVLAIIVGMTNGEVNETFWIRLGISISVFIAAVLVLFPLIGRWFFKRFNDAISQYIFVLAMVFLAAFLAEAAGVEAIIGAFLAGLALNRLVPHTSALMNRVEFVGNALFIPFFLIGVGMLIDYRIFFKDLHTLTVGGSMILIATTTKYVAAWLTQKTFGYTTDERKVIFGLSNAQAAATLAAVLVGYNIILGYDASGNPIRLLNESILNGTILMILVTCTIATFSAQRGAQAIALKEEQEDGTKESETDNGGILIPVNNETTTEELVALAVTLTSKKEKKPLYALNIIDDVNKNEERERRARKLLDKAAISAAATGQSIQTFMRYDINLVNGISNVVKEQKISDIILGLHDKSGFTDSFLGNLTEGLLSKCNSTTYIYKIHQPLSTVQRHIVILPPSCEREIGFVLWINRLWNLAANSGARLVFYAHEKTIQYLQAIMKRAPIDAMFYKFENWDDFLIISRDVETNDNLILVMSRKNHTSYANAMSRIPYYLNKYFEWHNFILIYPVQSGVTEDSDVNLKDPSVTEPLEKLDEIGRTIARIFRRK